MADGDYMVEMRWKCTSCGNVNLGRETVCTRCGNPMDKSEHYVMPDDPSIDDAVTDPELLRMARADPNWRCPYCGSAQRAANGTCANCGGGKAVDSATSSGRGQRTPGRAGTPSRRGALIIAAVGFLVMLMFFGGAVGYFLVSKAPPNSIEARPPSVAAKPTYRDVSATVSKTHWTSTVTVKRWQLVDRAGFADSRPTDAQHVKQVGQKVHHTDKVPDGFRTESYTETVPDGFRTETYTARESCGQQCTPRPRSCRQVCRSRKNGFASCRQVCTGGGQSCRTKYCTRTKTRQVAKTRVEHRTRQVQKYRDVPRLQPWFTWKQWSWETNRVVKREGDDSDPKWPEDEKVKLGQGLGKGEKERAVKSRAFLVQFVDPNGGVLDVHPKSDAQFRSMTRGTTRTLRVHASGEVQVLDGK